jgi:hypothetical protein
MRGTFEAKRVNQPVNIKPYIVVNALDRSRFVEVIQFSDVIAVLGCDRCELDKRASLLYRVVAICLTRQVHVVFDQIIRGPPKLDFVTGSM